MSKAKNDSQENESEWISYRLDGDEADRFRRYKKRQNLKNNAEAARKALFDQIEVDEGEAA